MNFSKRIKLKTIYLFVLIVTLSAACKFTSKEPEFFVNSNQIYSEFQQNEVAALAKYKGKKVRVTGTLISFTNTLGVNYCSIGSPGDLLGEVQCAMSDEFAKTSSQYKIGQEMWVEGTCSGVDMWGRVQIR